ncbi:type VI secretion system protein [Phaeospirillum tilakii]|uniref:Type VI secretion system protein n=1 Tax=Phaeospirillum tilakii TaxID=741673 RepID=A0ABW5C8F5_9PROT
MTPAAAAAPGWLPVLLLGLLVLLLIALAVAAIVLWRRHRAARDKAPPPTPARALRRQVRQALGTLARLGDAGADPYAVPWIVALGAEGADTPRLLAAIDSAAPAEASVIPGAGAVHFLPQGAVFHAGDSLIERPGGLDHWRQLVRLLAECRPHRPLDGLVVVLPADALSGPAALPFDRVAEWGARLCTLIAAAQGLTGLRVPVSIVIDRCDRLPGLAALIGALPEAARDAPLGWANPYALETAFQPDWADQAVETVAAGLSDLGIQLLLGETAPADPDPLLLAPSEVRALLPRLKPLLAAMFQPSAYHEAFLFRGLFLAGASDDEGPGQAFVPGLFNHRVFREFQLVRPVRGLLTRRTRRLRLTQAALAASLLAAAAGLTALAVGAPRRAFSFETLLTTIQSDLTHRRQSVQRLDIDAVRGAASRLLQGLARLDVETVTTPLAPLAYLYNPDHDLIEAIAIGYGAIVVSEMHRRFETRLDDILTGPADLPDGGDPIDSLARTVDALAEFDDVYRTYQDLPQLRSSAALDKVAGYTLALSLGDTFQQNDRTYREAMGITSMPALDHARQTIGAALRRQFAAAYQAKFDIGALRRRLDRIAVLSRGGDRAMAPLDLLVDLRGQLQAIGDDLDSHNYGWINGEGADLGPRLNGLLDRLAGLQLVEGGDVAALRAMGEEQIRTARRTLIDTLSRQSLPQIRVEGGKVVLADSLAALKQQLDALMAHPVMSEPLAGPAELRTGARPLLWDLPGLKQATRLTEDQITLIAADLPRFPPALAGVVERAATEQAGLRITAAIAAAAQPAERVLTGPYQMDTELKALIGVQQPLTGLADQLFQARLDRVALRLGDTVQTQALRLLGEIDRLSAGLILTAAPPDFSWWDGSLPVAARAFRASSLPELSLTLEGEREVLTRLSRDGAEPLLRLIATFAAEDGNRPLVAKWQGIARAIARDGQKDQNASLRQLENFILTAIDRLDPAQCRALAAAPPTPGGDLFALELDRLKANLGQRCVALAGERIRARYAEIQTLFNQTLARRFPFSADARPEAPRAEALAVRRFFWALDQAPLPARAELAAAAGGPAADFAAALTAAETALAPMLVDPTLDQPLAYAVSAEFRANPANDSGGNQVIEWTLECGPGQGLSSRDPKKSVVWSSGQPVRLSVRFAANAPGIPAADPQGRYRVDGATARWEANDPWALLSLIAAQGIGDGQGFDLADRRPHLLGLDVELQRNPAAAPGAALLPHARLYLRLGLDAVIRRPGKPEERSPLLLPVFPVAAPGAEGGAPQRLEP